MKSGDVVLYANGGKVSVGIISLRYKDKRWYIQPAKKSGHFVLRHEKFLTPIKDIKKYLDISNKI